MTTIPSPIYITDRVQFQDYCQQLTTYDRLALDTEFVGEDTFVPRLELIQIATPDFCLVIDVPAVGDIGPLGESLHDPKIEKIVHAGRQDLELFSIHTGKVPNPFFDTQIAAAMVGYGTQVAYAQLVQRVVGKRLEKAHTFTNWSRRPLHPEQVTYAAEDVQFLLAVHDHLRLKLTALGREEWVQEEFTRFSAALQVSGQEPTPRWQRIRGWESLKPRTAAVLRELVGWREQEARRRNVPRGRVVRDEVLVELARRPPKDLSGLKATRGLHPSEIDRSGETILSAIRQGRECPDDQLPVLPAQKKPEPEAAGQVDLLQAVLKARASDLAIAPSLLASASDLQELVEAKGDREQLEVPLLRGWRRDLAGTLLLQVLRGAVTVSIDPSSGRIVMSDSVST